MRGVKKPEKKKRNVTLERSLGTSFMHGSIRTEDRKTQVPSDCEQVGLGFYCLVQNKHSTRSGHEASEAMLIFAIMGGQWMDGFFDEPSARAVNSPPPSCYKDSIEQVAPAMPCACHEPN